MKRILIVGASGMVGKIILKAALEDVAVAEIVSLARRPSGISDTKLQEKLHEDFSNFDSQTSAFKNIDAAHFCIGLYQGTVPDAEFKLATVDYAVAFANKLAENSPKARLCFLSGAGADRKEKSRMKFAKYKGMAENHLIQTIPELHIFRPAYIYPIEKRQEPSLAYRIYRRLYPLLKNILPSTVIISEQLAMAMHKVSLEGNELQTLENEEIKKVLTP